MKQEEFVTVIQNISGLPEGKSLLVWEALCEKMANSIASGHGFGIPNVGRIYIRNHRMGGEQISFVNFQPNKELLAKMNNMEQPDTPLRDR